MFFGDATRGYDSGSRSNPDPYLQGRDRVYDFAPGDKIDLRGVDADATRAGRQPFTFVGTAPFSGPGQARYRFEPDDVFTGRTMTVVALSTDADPAAGDGDRAGGTARAASRRLHAARSTPPAVGRPANGGRGARPSRWAKAL